jgi:hypothetical protein
MYNRTQWKDRVVDQTTGEVIQEGTLQSAGNFNNMEDGIEDATVAAAFLVIAAGQLDAQTAAEEKTVTLTNTQSYPFNNSQKTVSLSTTRTTTAYSVDVEVLEHSGDVGDVLISDKLLNGFKVRFDGSAKSATVKLIIKGGM